MVRKTSVTIIFDGDDTLWRTHFLFKRAKMKVANMIAAQLRTSPDEFICKVDEYSVRFAEQHGFTNKRFPTALCQAYKYFSRIQSMVVDTAKLRLIWDIGWNVNTAKSEPMPLLVETLDSLLEKYRLVLYTLGESDTQLSKVKLLGLTHYFDEGNIFPVLKKGEEPLREILARLKLSPKLTWMIGNSASSDIAPALKLGLNCIWMLTEHWLFDDAEIDSNDVFTVTSLYEIPPIIDTWLEEL